MYPGGEHRIDETGGIADKYESGRPEAGVDVGVVLPDTIAAIHAALDPGRTQEQRLDFRTGIDEFPHRALGAGLEPFGMPFRDHGPDTGQCGGERDVPEPAVGGDAGEDVAAVGVGQASGPIEGGKERDILEELRIHPLPRMGMEPALIARRIDDESCPRIRHPAGAVLQDNAGNATLLVDDPGGAGLLAHFHPMATGIARRRSSNFARSTW